MPVGLRRPPSGAWGERIDTLIKAIGVQARDFKRVFTVSRSVVLHARMGKLPRQPINFLRRLQWLEMTYAQDIADLAAGHITVDKYGRRTDWRRQEAAPVARPADLAEVGLVGTAAETGRGAGVPAPAPRKLVYVTRPRGAQSCTYRKVATG